MDDPVRELMIDKAEDPEAIIDASVAYRQEQGRDDQAHAARLVKIRQRLEDAIRRHNETSARLTRERQKAAFDPAGEHRRWTALEIEVESFVCQLSPRADSVRLRVLNKPGRATYLDIPTRMLARLCDVLSEAGRKANMLRR